MAVTVDEQGRATGATDASSFTGDPWKDRAILRMKVDIRKCCKADMMMSMFPQRLLVRKVNQIGRTEPPSSNRVKQIQIACRPS